MLENVAFRKAIFPKNICLLHTTT